MHFTIVLAVFGLAVVYFWSWRFVMPTAALASRTPRLPLLLLVLGVSWACGTGWLTSTVARAGLLTREPLVGFFLESDELFSFSQHSRSRQMPEEAARARADYPRGQTFQKKNVVLIMVDSLRADRTGPYGYQRPTTPFLASRF